MEWIKIDRDESGFATVYYTPLGKKLLNPLFAAKRHTALRSKKGLLQTCNREGLTNIQKTLF